jgi:hypothetical protein
MSDPSVPGATAPGTQTATLTAPPSTPWKY